MKATIHWGTQRAYRKESIPMKTIATASWRKSTHGKSFKILAACVHASVQRHETIQFTMEGEFVYADGFYLQQATFVPLENVSFIVGKTIKIRQPGHSQLRKAGVPNAKVPKYLLGTWTVTAADKKGIKLQRCAKSIFAH